MSQTDRGIFRPDLLTGQVATDGAHGDKLRLEPRAALRELTCAVRQLGGELLERHRFAVQLLGWGRLLTSHGLTQLHRSGIAIDVAFDQPADAQREEQVAMGELFHADPMLPIPPRRHDHQDDPVR